MKGIDRICFLTDARAGGSPGAVVRALLESGIRWVQYREKDKTKRDMYEEALHLRELTRRFGACFIVNDYADLALAVDADGVHLGQDDLPLAEARKIMGHRIIGISAHSLREAEEAERGGADYIGFGSIFPTTTKEVGAPRGVEVLKEIKAAVRIPVIAIGGIKADNAASVFAAGCDGVAVSSGLFCGDVRENAKRFLEIAHKGRVKREE
ncbi:MAG: thiamine phosphate synthase [Alphaproteobacteria bacterium]|uniref:Thiamine-phosphate synthase n=1 Tax=Candidatus Nitrobium versatile TaxID=2884831 RepID=A0A953J4K4_9BACT|nr:thiamine phosphate synthase [Candidatus Nitrobium versatile]